MSENSIEQKLLQPITATCGSMRLGRLSDVSSHGCVASLISFWPNEHCLWDSTSLEYSNGEQKNAAVCRIAEELNLSEC